MEQEIIALKNAGYDIPYIVSRIREKYPGTPIDKIRRIYFNN